MCRVQMSPGLRQSIKHFRGLSSVKRNLALLIDLHILTLEFHVANALSGG